MVCILILYAGVKYTLYIHIAKNIANRNTPYSIFMTFVNTCQEKQILINNLKINYKIFGEGTNPIILLHGWGINSDKYMETANQLVIHDSRFVILVLDLPGFGKSDNPLEAWNVDDYVELVKEFAEMSLRGAERRSNPEECAINHGIASPCCCKARNDKVILIGHSFGGRIAIKFSAKYPEKVKYLILTGAAGIKHPLTVKQKIFFLAAKIGKTFFSLPLANKAEKLAQKLLYRAAREKDYYKAQGIMKETFKKVIAEDLTPYLEKITNPTLLVWGKNDRSTPLSDAFIMKEKIKKCELVVVEDANHGLPYKNAEEFSKITSTFIKKG